MKRVFAVSIAVAVLTLQNSISRLLLKPAKQGFDFYNQGPNFLRKIAFKTLYYEMTNLEETGKNW